MERKAVSGIMLTLLLTSMLMLAFNTQQVKAAGAIYIRADGSIDPPTAPISSVDKITYMLTDHIVADIPEGPPAAIIVQRDNIVFDGAGYTVQGTWRGTGIALGWRSNVTIKNMEIKEFIYGIDLSHSSNITISGNKIEDNFYNIHLDSSSNNSIYGNNIKNKQVGIRLESSSFNRIFGNNITGNNWRGIDLMHSSNNTISRNNITDNGYGIWLEGSSNNLFRDNSIANNDRNFGVWEDFLNDVDASNTVNGKPIYYWINKRDMAVPLDAGYVVLVNCTNVTVQNLSLTNNGQGVLLAYTTNSTIIKNNITKNYHGIQLSHSTNNSISGNYVTNNDDGIWLSDYSEFNSISRNNITANNSYGILIAQHSNYNSISGNDITNNGFGVALLEYSEYNMISKNEVTNNKKGIFIYLRSSFNVIYHNNFINNTQQAVGYGFPNILDNGYPSGGNYWSDYAGVDLFSGPYQNETGSDDIGDTPYVIDGNNQDNYPLMEPWSLKPPSPVEATQELIETIETWNLPKGTENSLKTRLKVAIHMLDMGKEDGAIRKLSAFINRVEMLREKTLTNEQADYLVTEAQRIIDLINE